MMSHRYQAINCLAAFITSLRDNILLQILTQC
jgi:hypothetical protein